MFQEPAKNAYSPNASNTLVLAIVML